MPDARGTSQGNRLLVALGRETSAPQTAPLAQKLRQVLTQHFAWLWQEHPGTVIVTPTAACAGWPILFPIRSSSTALATPIETCVPWNTDGWPASVAPQVSVYPRATPSLKDRQARDGSQVQECPA